MTALLLAREAAYAGYLAIDRLTLRLEDGSVVVRDVERHGDAAVVLPYDPERRCGLVVRLLRAAVLTTTGETLSEEACAGMIDAEDAADAARREAREELGVDLGALEFVGRVWSSSGVSTERLSLYLARYGLRDRRAAGGGLRREHEAIAVVERPLADLAADADRRRISDAKLLMLVQTLRLGRPDLFAPSTARLMASPPVSQRPTD